MPKVSFAQRVAEKLDELHQAFATSRRERIRADQGDGREHPDPTPHSLAVDMERPPTMEELIQRYVRNEVSAQAAADGHETWEEADDFEEVDPEELPFTPYVLSEHQLVEELPLPEPAPSPGEPPETAPEPSEAPEEPPREAEPLPLEFGT